MQVWLESFPQKCVQSDVSQLFPGVLRFGRLLLLEEGNELEDKSRLQCFTPDAFKQNVTQNLPV